MRSWYRATAWILVVMGVTAAAAAQGGGPPPAIVVLDPARMETVDQWREVTGELRATRRSRVASRQPGQVVALHVEEGSVVATGQEIARLDATLADLAVRAAEATVQTRRAGIGVREAELDRWRKDWARYASLEGNAAVSKTEFDQAKAQVAVAEAALVQARADLAAAEAALASTRERLAQLVVTAPYAGRVWKKLTDVGQWVAEGEGVVEIVALDRLEARLDVPEALAASLREGASAVRVRVKALGEERPGTVQAVMPAADELSRLFAVRVVLANEGERLRPGMSITGLVATGTNAPTLTVHKDAILRDDAGEYVYWNAGGAAMVARVRTLFAVGDRVAVSGALPPGAEVIVKGNERILFPGQPVMDPAKPPPAGADAARKQ
jgi:RND family efflux transporter MFP subunit